MLRIPFCAPVACALLLSACGAGVLFREELDSGAQHGWIVGFYSADTPQAQLPECLAGRSRDELSQHTFARVQYHRGRGMPIVTAELPKSLSASVGDDVAMRLKPCTDSSTSLIFNVVHRAESR